MGLRSLPATEARFPGRCGVCDGRYEEGDRIAKLPGDEEWVHAACAAEEGHNVEGEA